MTNSRPINTNSSLTFSWPSLLSLFISLISSPISEQTDWQTAWALTVLGIIALIKWADVFRVCVTNGCWTRLIHNLWWVIDPPPHPNPNPLACCLSVFTVAHQTSPGPSIPHQSLYCAVSPPWYLAWVFTLIGLLSFLMPYFYAFLCDKFISRLHLPLENIFMLWFFK